MTKQQIMNNIHADILPLWKKQKKSCFSDEEWHACLIEKYTLEEKKQNEALVDELRNKIRKKQFSYDAFLEHEQILYIQKYMSKELFDDYLKSMCTFLRNSRSFDPELNTSQIWQALRNYLIYGMICAMMNKNLKCHDSIMSYSLLYPYTDNYIDTSEHTLEQKSVFNQMIFDRLHGKDVTAQDYDSQKTKECLDMALNYLGSSKLDETAQMLLIMLDAQVESTTYMGLDPVTATASIYKIFESLAYKGGVSVLIDYYYSTDSISDADAIFFLKFGLILQLADDIQDIAEDLENTSPTYYNVAETIAEREARLFELLHFVKTVFTDYQAPNSDIQKFMLRNCELMLLFAVIRSKEYFSRELLMQIEPYIPFSYEYLMGLKEEIDSRTDSIMDQEKILKAIDAFCDHVLK